jgi:hypothetical protein
MTSAILSLSLSLPPLPTLIPLDRRHRRILILQHPRESKKKTIGTVPLIKLVLGHGCEVIVSPTNGKRNSGRYFNDHPKVLEAAAQSGEMSVNKIVPLSGPFRLRMVASSPAGAW